MLARGCLIASGYVAAVILARNLGATDYGIYGVVTSQLFWLELLASAGVPGAISILMAQGRHQPGDVERSAHALLLGLSIPLFVVCWVLAPQVASLMRIPEGEVLLRIAIIDLPFAAVYAAYIGILNSHRWFGILAVAQAVYGMAKLAGVATLIGLGFSVERAIVANVASTCVVCLVLALSYRPLGLRFQRPIAREIAVLAAPMALYLVAGQVLVNVDLWVLKSLWEGGGEVVGHYVAAGNLARTLAMIPTVQAGVLFASVAWAAASRDAALARRHIREATRFALIIAAPGFVLLGLDASEVLSVLFSSAYADGGRFLGFLLAGFGLFALLDAFAQSLMAAGRQWFVAGALAAMLPLVWLSNYLLIPRFGPMGAATSMLLGIGITTALIGGMAYRHFGSLVRFSTLGRVLAAAALIGLVSAVVPVRGPLVLVKLALLGGLYLLALRVLGEITRDDLGLRGTRSADPGP